MKKFSMLIVAGLSAIFLLTGCGHTNKVKETETGKEKMAKKVENKRPAKQQAKETTISTENFEKVSFDMTKDDLQKQLGEPVKVIDDQKEIEKIVKKEMKNLMMASLTNKDKVIGFFGGEEKMQELSNSVDDGQKLILQQYKYVDSKQKEKIKNVYLLEDKVVFKTF